MKVYVLHENPEWYPPFAAAFDAAGLEHEQWLLGSGALDLDAEPPAGVFWSRMSASSHTRGHPYAKDHTRAVLSWLEAHGRRVVNGRRVLELEMSKADQLTALRAAGIEVPRTVAVAGREGLTDAAGKFATPFIAKHNQGGKGLGVRLFGSIAEFADHLDSAEYEPPVDGITLVQEYVRPERPFITRVEIVGGELVSAITADTARGGFELCPADACAVPSESLFALREGFEDHPIVPPLPGLRRQARDRDRRLRVHRDRGRPPGHLRRQHQHQLQPGGRGRGQQRSGSRRLIARYLKTLLDEEREGGR